MGLILKSLFVLGLLISPGYAEKDEVKKKEKVADLPEMAMGSSKAPVTVINYSSLTCTHCAEFHTETLPKIEKKYIKPGLVRIVFRDYPGDQLSLIAHQLAWCKGQLKYFDLVKLIFSKQDDWLSAPDPKAALKAVLIKHGISGEKFDACLQNDGLMDQIIQERLSGQKKYNITATPTLVINTKIYPEALPFDQFEEAVDPLLNPKKDKKDAKTTKKDKPDCKKEVEKDEKAPPPQDLKAEEKKPEAEKTKAETQEKKS